MADLKNTYITLKLGNGGGGSIDPSVLEGYATSGDMQSAFTLISETQQVAAAGLNQLEGRIDELSGATPSVDLSGYWTSAETQDAITSKNYVTSAQVETQIVSKNYITSAETANFVTSAQVETQIVAKNYITSAATADMVTSTYVSTIWKGTQAQYDAITTKDPYTFYIIVNN